MTTMVQPRILPANTLGTSFPLNPTAIQAKSCLAVYQQLCHEIITLQLGPAWPLISGIVSTVVGSTLLWVAIQSNLWSAEQMAIVDRRIPDVVAINSYV